MVDVEKRATLAVEDVLSRCRRLVGFIDSNDKTPLTDGFIQIYQGVGRKKSEMAGRVDVQVKGRTVRQKLAPASFPIARSDLQSIQQLGTVLLFVSFVRPDGSYIGRLKYAVLSPYTVGIFLSEMKKSARTFPVPLRDLPDEVADVESIVHIAHRTKRQSVFVGSGLESLERSTQITISSAQKFTFDEPLLISPRTGDFVVEVRTPEGLLIPLPGELEILPASYSERPLEAVVRCGSNTYTDATIRQVDTDLYELKLSDGLTLTQTIENGVLVSGAATLNLAPSLLQRIRDIDFFLALSAGEPLFLDDHELVYERGQPTEHDDLEAVRARLGELVVLLESLNVDCSLIRVDEITERQRKQLGYLHGSLFEGMGIKAEETDSKTALVATPVGQWQLYMLLLPDPQTGVGAAVDPFNTANRNRFRLYSTDETGARVEAQATVYDMLDREEIPQILNLNTAAVVGAYKAISDAPAVRWLANRSALRFIHAADDCEQRRQEFLDTADALNNWLEALEGSSDGTSLNRFQIQARRPEGLSSADKTAIRAIRRGLLSDTASDTTSMQAGCAILLGDDEELHDCLAALSPKERRDFESYPIWSLHTQTSS